MNGTVFPEATLLSKSEVETVYKGFGRIPSEGGLNGLIKVSYCDGLNIFNTVEVIGKEDKKDITCHGKILQPDGILLVSRGLCFLVTITILNGKILVVNLIRVIYIFFEEIFEDF